MENFINSVREQISDIDFEQGINPNLTINERKALRNLQDDNSIIINKADKGSTIVIQNHKDYATEDYEHHNDVTVYR